MKFFSEWLVTKFYENNEIVVSGPGIEKLVNTVFDMANRGAPTENNNYGFNKQDWDTFIRYRSYLSQRDIPVNIVTIFIRVLNRYKNTQIPNFEQINALVNRDLLSVNQNSGHDGTKIHVFSNEPLEYGKIKVFIPNGIDNSEIRGINTIVDDQFQSEGAEKQEDNYGKYTFPRFKKFQKDKTNPNLFWIHRSVLNQILEYLKSKRNIEVTGNEPSITPPETPPAPAPAPNPETPISRSPQENEVGTSDIRAIEFFDLPANKMKIKVDYRHPNLDQGKKNFIKELIQYTFPEYRWDKDGFFYEIEGNYQQYASFGKLLKKFGYNVDKLRDILKAKLDSTRITRDKYYGQYDSEEPFKKLEQDMDEKLPENSYELYKQQKEGVAFLYGRHHAILGDETGFGKTIQLITAAALRMSKDNQPTLIITLKATQQQWVDTIKSVMGDQETLNISTDGTNPKKWTVLYYENFSSGKQVAEVINKCKQANFGIAILDELHKLKHETSKRSQNIAEVLENIPTVWGASATVSANKPMDVKNQLRIVKHHLGKVSDNKFKRDFAGQKPTGYRGAYEESDEDESLKSAERLNRWLNLSGLYVRRSKDDLREMPALNRAPITPTTVNDSDFSQKYLSKVQTYKDPTLPISKMIAAREVVAQLKTDSTTDKVVKIIKDNANNPANNFAASKVVVFTNFIESANQLVEKLSSAIREINPSFKVITYLANTKKRERSQVKANFTNDPNAKVLVMSMKMGGTGIDFPNASQHMVVNDFDWTPESAEQSEGRIYRINTNHPVNIHYTIANGIDSKLFEKVQEKRRLAAIVQQYRKDYHQKEHDPDTLHKIVLAQKQIKAIDDDMATLITTELPSEKRESFREFFNTQDGIKKYLFSA